MSTFTGYRCSICGHEYAPTEVTYVCPKDGGNLDILLDYGQILDLTSPADIQRSPEFSIWRYQALLPVVDPGYPQTPLHTVGWTPLYALEGIGGKLGTRELWVKDDGRNPTASFKDRASAVTIARALEIDAETVVTASTGNAGAALAGMAAAVGVPAVILAPKTAPPAKVAQLLMFGAEVVLVEGTYDDAFDLTVEAATHFGWYCRNTGYNPFTAEGKKTAAYEICEQLTRCLAGRGERIERWLAPDVVFVSVGDGNIISGLHKGFKDLLTLGWIDQIPRIMGVQSVGSAAIANAFEAGTEKIQAVHADTLADSISVDLPRDGLRALRAATQTGGAYLKVEDMDILAAMRVLAGEAAIFAEPAGATSYAGFLQALERGLIQPDEKIVVLNTGNGLKDISAAMKAAGSAKIIEPTLQALQTCLETAPRQKGG